MVLTMLMLTAGLRAMPQAEPQKGWIVEVRGYTSHSGAKAKGWIIELQGFSKHRGQEVQPNRQKAVQEVIIPSVYVEDLRAYFNPLKQQEQIETVETHYVEDLSVFFKRLKKKT